MNRVRRTVRLVEGIARNAPCLQIASGQGLRFDTVQRFFGPGVSDRYVVRYYLNDTGKYTVDRIGGLMTVTKTGGTGFPVCFLPWEWHGRRVSRETWRVK